MMTSDFILDVSEADFEFEVLAYSQNVPVVVDFWAEWCRPCRKLGPVIEELAREAGNGVKVGKLNVDENPATIQGIPTVILFKDGNVKEQLVGAQPKAIYQQALKALDHGAH